MQLKSNNKILSLDSPQVMAILNVTPDSFSDGGRYNDLDTAVRRAEKMIEAGVSIIDIGGESTRPGAAEVTLQDELARTIPVIEAIRKKHDVWISIDTSKAEVMRQALLAGADIINDIRSLSEPGAMAVAAEFAAPVCIMHMQGQPQNMQDNPNYLNLLDEVNGFLTDKIAECEKAGIRKENIIIDPGFGFGKTLENNYQLLNHFERFQQYDLPILAGMSRKSMIHNALNKMPADCVAGSVACATIAAMKGAHIIRVHDFAETLDAMKVVCLTQNNK